jgi:beta-lactamase regulating signal transducer with metallopeptidase domain
MSVAESVLGGAAATATGWALVHALWQATLVAGILAVALHLLRNRSASARYVAACVALGLTIVLPAATGIAIFDPLPDTAEAGATFHGESASAVDAAFPDGTMHLGLDPRLRGIPIEPTLPWVVAMWLAGVALCSARLAFGLTSVGRLRRHGTSPAPSPVEQAAAGLAEAMGIGRAVRILRSSNIEVPTVIGLLEPVILVPAAALSGLTPQQLRAILAHELAHVRRHDFAVNLAQSAVETLLFFHPAVWWISGRIRVERENCCDDIAVDLCGDPVGYARALATMEELRADLLPAVAATGGSLSGRIKRMLGIRDEEFGTAGPVVAVISAIAVAMVAVLPLSAGSYVDDAVSVRASGEAIVVIGHPGEDIADVVDAVIDAHLYAADASEIARRAADESRAQLDEVRVSVEAEVARAREAARSVEERRSIDLAHIRAEVERARAAARIVEEESLVDLEQIHAEVARALEAAESAAAIARVDARQATRRYGRTFVVAPVAPVAPTPPVPLVSPVAPVARPASVPPPPAPVVAPMTPLAPVTPAPPAPAVAPVAPAFELWSDLRRSTNERPLDPDNPTAEELALLDRFDIDPIYARELRKAGLDDLSAHDLVRMRSLGVDAAWVKSIRDAGYADATTTDLLRLKALGIDASYVAELNATRHGRFSVRDLLRLKSAGITAADLDRWK